MKILYLTVSYRLWNKEPVDTKRRQSSSNLHDAEENVISVVTLSLSYVSSPLNQNFDSFYFTRFLNYNELEIPVLVLNSVKVVMRLLVTGKSSSGLVLFGFGEEQ